MKTDATELPRVAKDERAFLLREDEVIMFLRAKSAGLEAELAAHAEMKAEPVVAGEDEEHLLAARFRAQKFVPNEKLLQLRDVAPAKDPFFAMQLHAGDHVAHPGVPALTEIFDLGQLRHEAMIIEVGCACDSSGEHGLVARWFDESRRTGFGNASVAGSCCAARKRIWVAPKRGTGWQPVLPELMRDLRLVSVALWACYSSGSWKK